MDPQTLIGPVSTRAHVISNFDSFILSHVPYGEVRQRDVQWGAVQYDGPDAPGIGGAKPIMQWHFGGVPYPISKAVRIPYTFVQLWDGSNETITSSILLGFQDRLSDYMLPQPIPYVARPTQTFRTRTVNFGPFGAFSNQAWGSDAAVLGSEAIGTVTRAVVTDANPQNQFDNFIQNELNLDSERFGQLQQRATPVDFDGPAQTSDSHNVFRYTLATLIHDPQRYGQLLFWYFAGKPFRLSKAMRIPLDILNIDPAANATNPSFVIDAVETAVAKTKTKAVRFKELNDSEKAATAIRTALISNATSDVIAKLPNPAPEGRAVFIGFSGTGSDPGG